MGRIATGLAMLLLAGCQDARDVDLDPCGAGDPYRLSGSPEMRRGVGLVGLPAREVDFPEGRDLRVLGPEDVATMDFVETRLNVRTDAEGRIVSLSCG